MVVNFQRVHKINRGAPKLHRTSKLIIIIKKKKGLSNGITWLAPD